ncbi:MAG TPA: nicotinate-nucleotide adenylyltransferase [Rhodothermales bacterium]
MRIGLFGGAFNPPHLAHLVVAESARVHAALDRVLWIPTGRPPHKPDTPLAPSSDRFEMAERAIKGNPFFEVSDVEVRRPGPSYMIETIAILKDLHPHDRFDLVIGGDSLDAFHTWFRFEEIIRQAQLIVFDRHGLDHSHVSSAIMDRVNFVTDPLLLQISSSDIRRRVAAAKSIRYLVPETVEYYIRRQHLYAA